MRETAPSTRAGGERATRSCRCCLPLKRRLPYAGPPRGRTTPRAGPRPRIDLTLPRQCCQWAPAVGREALCVDLGCRLMGRSCTPSRSPEKARTVCVYKMTKRDAPVRRHVRRRACGGRRRERRKAERLAGRMASRLCGPRPPASPIEAFTPSRGRPSPRAGLGRPTLDVHTGRQPDDERERTVLVRSLAYEADEADVRKLFRHIPDVAVRSERAARPRVVLPSKNDMTAGAGLRPRGGAGEGKVRVRRGGVPRSGASRPTPAPPLWDRAGTGTPS